MIGNVNRMTGYVNRTTYSANGMIGYLNRKPDMLAEWPDILTEWLDMLIEKLDLCIECPDRLTEWPKMLTEQSNLWIEWPDMLTAWTDMLTVQSDLWIEWLNRLTEWLPDKWTPQTDPWIEWPERLTEWPDILQNNLICDRMTRSVIKVSEILIYQYMSRMIKPSGKEWPIFLHTGQISEANERYSEEQNCVRPDSWRCWCRLCKYVTWSVGCLGVSGAARGEQLIASQGQEWMGIRTTSKRSWFSK
jgi:hypothetical protein